MMRFGACEGASQMKDKSCWDRASALSSWHMVKELSSDVLAASRRDLLAAPHQLLSHPPFWPEGDDGQTAQKRQQGLSGCIQQAFRMPLGRADQDSRPG